MNQANSDAPRDPSRRIALLDVARGVAMVAMTIFHFSWDLEFFGYAPPGMTSDIGWKLFARCIAASFLMISGISLMLAHMDGIRWSAFWKRFAMVGGAAMIISVSTYIVTPERFVFFGILHQITAASLLALLFLRLPALVIFMASLAFLALPFLVLSDFFSAPYFWWSGLASFDPPSNDYVPVFPWTGFVLAGMAIAKMAFRSGLLQSLSTVGAGSSWLTRFMTFLGRHSLLYYLIHQPLMMAAVYGMTLIVAPAPFDNAALFVSQCTVGCKQDKDRAFCERFCGCVRSDLEAQAIFQDVLDGKRDVSSDPVILNIGSVCTAEAEE
jgi:uncharacterized membrane protein